MFECFGEQSLKLRHKEQKKKKKVQYKRQFKYFAKRRSFYILQYRLLQTSPKEILEVSSLLVSNEGMY